MRTTRRVIILAAGAISMSVAAAASAAAFTGAGAAAPAWPAAQGWTTGVRPPGAGDASAVGAAGAAGSWGRAIEVPGLGALNKGGYAQVDSVSCASAGNCAAGGVYWDRHAQEQGFVAAERNGRWGRAIKVPGLAALGGGDVFSVSCASAGNCAAGGSYIPNRHGYFQGFVAVERRGVWGRASEVPGLGALNKGGLAFVLSVSCASAGNCAAGGNYASRHGQQGFVAVERHGRWGRAIEVPGLGALNTRGDAVVNSVSCPSAGTCAAGGQYSNHRHPVTSQGFVAVERHGRWGRAIEVPGLGALNKGSAVVNSVWCASAGNCAAGGNYKDSHGHRQGFVVSQRHGRWGRAIEVPGLGALNTGGNAGVLSVSCGSAGNCAAGGAYTDNSGLQGFVAAERDGRWGTAIEVPGLGALDAGGDAFVDSVSCAPAGTCAAGGDYADSPGHFQGFVVSQTV